MINVRILTKHLSLILSILSLFIVGACGASVENPLSKEAASEALAAQAGSSEQLIASDFQQAEKGEIEQTSKEKIQFESISNREADDSEKATEENDPVLSNHASEQKKVVIKQENALKNHSNQDPQKEVKQESARSDNSNQASSESNQMTNDSSDPPNEQEEGSPEKNKETKPEQTEEPAEETITYSIVISEDEIPLPPTEMTVKEDDTVLEALIRVTKEKTIQMDYRGGRGATAYVEGIDNVYEFDRGSGSGWMYRVNGIFPDRGAGVVQLLPGDRVEWLYTTDLGKDLGADLQPFRR